VAETVTPSVRGRQKLAVAAALLVAAAVSGGLAGFALGALWWLARAPALPVWAVVAVVVFAVAADVARRPRPPAVRRQVPQIWSELFAPVTVALLYGSRLGVGPLTILPTWLWWAGTVIAVATGPVASAAAGAVFGAVRALATIGVGEWARHAMAPRMGVVRRAERLAIFAGSVSAGVALGMLIK